MLVSNGTWAQTSGRRGPDDLWRKSSPVDLIWRFKVKTVWQWQDRLPRPIGSSSRNYIEPKSDLSLHWMNTFTVDLWDISDFDEIRNEHFGLYSRVKGQSNTLFNTCGQGRDRWSLAINAFLRCWEEGIHRSRERLLHHSKIYKKHQIWHLRGKGARVSI